MTDIRKDAEVLAAGKYPARREDEILLGQFTLEALAVLETIKSHACASTRMPGQTCGCYGVPKCGACLARELLEKWTRETPK